jgi:hypothetical protein
MVPDDDEREPGLSVFRCANCKNLKGKPLRVWYVRAAEYKNSGHVKVRWISDAQAQE